MFKYVLVLAMVATSTTFAADTVFKGESEATMTIVNGNSESTTVGAKTKNVWSFTELDSATLTGKYLNTKSNGVESAKNWGLALRYDHAIIKDTFTLFVQQMAEHDPYNGVFVQRDSTDLGAHYVIMKDDNFTWLAELGYRYTDTYAGIINGDRVKGNFVRAYTEASDKFNSSISGKIWFEYLSSLDTSKAPNRWNAEASLSMALTDILQLKAAYLVNHTDDVVAPAKADTTTWTTSLVANY